MCHLVTQCQGQCGMAQCVWIIEGLSRGAEGNAGTILLDNFVSFRGLHFESWSKSKGLK